MWRCLESEKGWHTSHNVPVCIIYQRIKEVNHNSFCLLTTRGFDYKKLQVHLKKGGREQQIITVPNSKEEIDILGKANSDGQRFNQTNWQHLTKHDILNVAELRLHREDRGIMKKDKACCEAAKNIKIAAPKVLEAQQANPQKTY